MSVNHQPCPLRSNLEGLLPLLVGLLLGPLLFLGRLDFDSGETAASLMWKGLNIILFSVLAPIQGGRRQTRPFQE